MAVKIRLQRKGRKKKPFYHIVIADARSKRDGRMIEKIGSYNPLTVPATIEIDRDKAYDWLMKGALPTNTVKAILRFNGIYYRKHLMRGVAKGAMTEEVAMEKYNAWVAEKEAANAVEVAKTVEKIKAHHRMIDGKAPAKVQKSSFTESADAPKSEGPKTLLESIDKTEIDTKSGEMVKATDVVEEVKEEVKLEAPAPVVEEVKEEVKLEAPAPVVEEVKEEVKVEAAPAKPKKAPKADDLKIIEGIGPKIAELLAGNGVDTWKKLAEAQPDALKEILAKGGSRYTMHNPTTWPKQAQLCVEEKWDDLKVLQDRLDGGVEKDA